MYLLVSLLCLLSGCQSLHIPIPIGRNIASNPESAAAAIVEVTRYRQPVCIAVPDNVPACAARGDQVMSPIEYREVEQISRSTNGFVDMGAIEPSMFDESNVDFRVREATPRLDRSFEYPEAPGAPAIRVTRVIDLPDVATLVARNCVPDVGLPLCDRPYSEDSIERISEVVQGTPEVFEDKTGEESVASQVDDGASNGRVFSKQEVGQTVKDIVQGIVDKTHNIMQTVIQTKAKEKSEVVGKIIKAKEHIEEKIGQIVSKKTEVLKSIPNKAHELIAKVKGNIEPLFSVAPCNNSSDLVIFPETEVRSSASQSQNDGNAQIDEANGKQLDVAAEENNATIESVTEPVAEPTTEILPTVAINTSSSELEQAKSNISEKSFESINNEEEKIRSDETNGESSEMDPTLFSEENMNEKIAEEILDSAELSDISTDVDTKINEALAEHTEPREIVEEMVEERNLNIKPNILPDIANKVETKIGDFKAKVNNIKKNFLQSVTRKEEKTQATELENYPETIITSAENPDQRWTAPEIEDEMSADPAETRIDSNVDEYN